MTVVPSTQRDPDERAPAVGGSAFERSAGRRASGRRPRFRTASLLVVVDLGALLLAVLVAGDLRRTTLLLAGLVVALLAAGGLYRHRLTLSVLDDAPAIVGRLLAAAGIAATARSLLGTTVLVAPRVRLAEAAVAFVLLGRLGAYSAIRGLRRTRRVGYRTLIVGAGTVGQQIATLLEHHPEHGLVPLGFYDPDPLPEAAEVLPVFDRRHGLAETIAALDTPVVIVAFSSASEPAMVDALRTCDRLDCEIFLVPRLFELHVAPGRHTDRIWRFSVVRLRRAAYRSLGWTAKRMIDVVVAAVGLLLLSPVLAVIAVAVWLDGRDGVLFRQERIGADQRRFTIYKFRSLRPASTRESSTTWNISHDDRLRPVGRLLRASSLDELPQLWNVVKGDMSLVGPRPERPHFVGKFSGEYRGYRHRHRVPCGLTGWAQVNGLRGDTSIEERAVFDNDYIEHWSLWNDTKILLRTLTAAINRRGS